MTCGVPSDPGIETAVRPCAAVPRDLVGAAVDDVLYTRQFFSVFAAVMLVMTGVALQFHFGQYVQYLGYHVDVLGRILSISMAGTLLIRLHIGRWIDRFGCKPVWIVGGLMLAAAVGTVQFVTRPWQIIILRSITTMSVATVLTTVAVFAAQIAPPRRRAESIGSMGLAGLTGMTIGPTIGDWIFAGGTTSIAPYRVFFSASAACSIAACLLIARLKIVHAPGTHALRTAQSPGAPAARDSTFRLVVRHWPGAIMLIGLVFSMAFCVQSMYLERFAEARGFADIKLFFLVYCPTAITLRVIFRRLPERMGRTRTALLGMSSLSVGLLCLARVDSEFGLVLPGVLMGAGHSFVFPSMVDLAAERMPPERRGMGTALILGAGDLGMLIGFLALGELIDGMGFERTIKLLAGAVLATVVFVAVARRRAVFARKSAL